MMNGWGWNPGSMYWRYGYGGGFIMILLGVVLIIGIVLLIRWAKHPDSEWHETGVNNKRTAREILDERYAKGDISREEYVQMKSDLEDKG